jgi:hypothetical protein
MESSNRIPKNHLPKLEKDSSLNLSKKSLELISKRSENTQKLIKNIIWE